ncbi:hypothetical protein BO79DRAFT_152920 [Aspergillus costaricaensis CBS 115574]|uniref:Uncharacterized protein n=1 Tax=Aspergillus costaricaensis CBS 115574 TaxID=1448317 RepID=A0ACD1I865_9EURO|nr:hypothetical protein BO79DRAFT_152920 [Aspergillus costaricaensis CBS 115574]RAK86771.1 hypothetical protein BO79DRAFT_152920 [Aspergillus costaricaensis CBS 115574]
MRPVILLSAQLRSALPRSVRRDLNSKLFARFKTTQNPVPPPKPSAPFIKRKEPIAPRNPQASPTKHAKLTFRKGPPEKVVVYYSGKGRTAVVGTLKLVSLLIFGVSCFLLAPAFASSDEHPWYLAPAIAIGGTLPMIFILYTTAPFVVYVHVAIPAFARRSRETMIEYVKNLPPTATLYMTTIRSSSLPQQTEVRLGDLVLNKSFLRPVTFTNSKPAPSPWWAGKTPQHFYTDVRAQRSTESPNYFPTLWDDVFKKIQNNGLKKQN